MAVSHNSNRPITSSSFTIYTDGGSRGNPGPAAAAFVVFDSNHHHLFTGGEFLGEATNNIAEYQGVLLALKYLSSIHCQRSTVHFNLDSKLVAEQLSGNYKIKEPHLKTLALTIFQLIATHQLKVDYRQIPRSQNQAADAQVNRILDAHLS